MLGPEGIGYTDILNEYFREKLQKEQDDGTGFQKTPIRPSASGQCARELAYGLMEFHKFAKYEKEAVTPELDRIFKMGHVIESHIIKDMREAFKGLFEVKYTQQNLSFAFLKAVNHPELSQWLEGSTDLVLMGKEFKCIADIKSKKDKFSSYRDSAWTEFNGKLRKLKSIQVISETAFYADDLEAFLIEVNDPFLAANFLQLNLYALNPFITERGIDHGAIIQYSKNDSKLREIRFRPSPKLYEYVIWKMQVVIDAVDHKDPTKAPQEHKLGSMKCAFCAFKKVCRPADDPLRAFFKNLPPKRWPKDTNRLGDTGVALEDLYDQYKEALTASEETAKLADSIIELLIEAEVDKVKFADGEVYEVKLLKSPKEHFELRRSKL
jgi:hypothetical protein